MEVSRREIFNKKLQKGTENKSITWQDVLSRAKSICEGKIAFTYIIENKVFGLRGKKKLHHKNPRKMNKGKNKS